MARRKKKTEKNARMKKVTTEMADSVSALAEEFMRNLSVSSGSPWAKDPSQTLPGDFTEGTERRPVFSPLITVLASLLVPAGGFLYIRQPIIAAASLVTIALSGTLFAALTQVLPGQMGPAILRDLAWPYELGPSLFVSGVVLYLSWSFSLLVPLVLARRSLMTEYHPNRLRALIILSAPIPVLGYLLKGEFWKALLSASLCLLLVLSAMAAVRIWFAAGVLPFDEVPALDPYFFGFVILSLLCFLLVLMQIGSGMIYFLYELGFLETWREGAQTEVKFIVLGFLVVAALFLYGFAGLPGERLRQRLTRITETIKDRGLVKTGSRLQLPIRYWDQAAKEIQDFAELFK